MTPTDGARQTPRRIDMMMQPTAAESAEMLAYFEGQEAAWARCQRGDWMLWYLLGRVSELTFRKLAWKLALETRVNEGICTNSAMSPEAKVRMYSVFDYLTGDIDSRELHRCWSESWTKGHHLGEQNNDAQMNANCAAASVLQEDAVLAALAAAEFACRAAGSLAALRGFEYDRAYNDARQDQADLIREMLPELPL